MFMNFDTCWKTCTAFLFNVAVKLPTVYISENDCCIVKSTKLSTIFAILYKEMPKKILNGRVVMATPNASQRSVLANY